MTSIENILIRNSGLYYAKIAGSMWRKISSLCTVLTDYKHSPLNASKSTSSFRIIRK